MTVGSVCVPVTYFFLGGIADFDDGDVETQIYTGQRMIAVDRYGVVSDFCYDNELFFVFAFRRNAEDRAGPQGEPIHEDRLRDAHRDLDGRLRLGPRGAPEAPEPAGLLVAESIAIDHHTSLPDWDGRRLDIGAAVSALA